MIADPERRESAPTSEREQQIQQGDAAKSNWYVRAFRMVVRALFGVLFRVRVVGLKNVPGTHTIVCINHLGWTDVFLVLLFFPVEPRIYVMGEAEVKDISAFRRWVINSLQVFVMLDRSKPVLALRTMEDVLRRDGSILICPEGRLGTQEGQLQPLQQGAAHTSVITGVPLLPVGLTGPSQLWLRRTLVVRIGMPIAPEDFQGSSRERTHAMTDRLATEMQKLLPGDREKPRIKLLQRWLTKLL
ncbi:MAG TPA: lysophospholipid acyltransferase family protein [Chloroflexia bacterium]|nr:lysophospholipid acyltransferase family protein [Chloroflexia bacterium]